MRIATIALMMVAFCLVTAQPASAQRVDRKRLRARLLQRFDRNDDGRLDRRERAAARQALMKLRAERRGPARRQRGAREQQFRRRDPRRSSGEFRQARRPRAPQDRVRRPGRARGPDRALPDRRKADRPEARRGRRTDTKPVPPRAKRAQKGQQASRRKQILKWFDANHDGRLDPKERRALLKVVGPPPKQPKQPKNPERRI